MKTKQLFLSAILLVALALPQSAFAYTFSAPSPSGQTLYYDIVSGEAQVVCPGTESWIGFNKPTGSLTIPATVNNDGTTYNVTSIGENAFANCMGLTAVSVSEGVSYIGNSAFAYCLSLSSIEMHDGIAYIGKNAFESCAGLSTLVIPNGVTFIDDYAFYGCSNVTSVTLPESLNYIGGFVFSHCSSLTSVVIPNGVTFIGESAFGSCTAMTSATIGEGLVTLCRAAFSGCSALTTVTIPSSVDSIGAYAFRHCTGLTTVNYNATNCSFMGDAASVVFDSCVSLATLNIGANVTNIPAIAFATCNSIQQITCNASVPPVVADVSAFDGISRNIPLYVPSGTIDSYKAAYAWSEFTNYQAGSTQGIGDVAQDDATVYSSHGQIMVEGAGSSVVALYDVNGRVLAMRHAEGTPLCLDVPSTGIYLVRIGNAPAHRTVVVR